MTPNPSRGASESEADAKSDSDAKGVDRPMPIASVRARARLNGGREAIRLGRVLNVRNRRESADSAAFAAELFAAIAADRAAIAAEPAARTIRLRLQLVRLQLQLISSRFGAGVAEPLPHVRSPPADRPPPAAPLGAQPRRVRGRVQSSGRGGAGGCASRTDTQGRGDRRKAHGKDALRPRSAQPGCAVLRADREPYATVERSWGGSGARGGAGRLARGAHRTSSRGGAACAGGSRRASSPARRGR